jgi:hypothetical protein
MRCIIAICLCVFVVGCAKPVPVTPTPDAQDAQSSPLAAQPSSCADACANLVLLKCPEGLRGDCESSCLHGSEITDFKTTCLAHAASVDEVRRCGTLGLNGGCLR